MTDQLATNTPEPPPVVAVVEWLTEGHRAQDVIDAIRTKFPGHEPAALMDAAARHFTDNAHSSTTIVVGWALEAYRDLYCRLVKIGDYPGAMRAIAELVKLKRDFSDEAE